MYERYFYNPCNNSKKNYSIFLKKNLLQTYFWVLNEEEDFKRAFELGATGIMTDYPTRLRKFLDNNSMENKSKWIQATWSSAHLTLEAFKDIHTVCSNSHYIFKTLIISIDKLLVEWLDKI